jgi:hypothetical protein
LAKDFRHLVQYPAIVIGLQASVHKYPGKGRGLQASGAEITSKRHRTSGIWCRNIMRKAQDLGI